MDLEFTGGAISNQTLIDSPSERYYLYKRIAEQYRIIQFGIVLWHKKSDNSYISRPYNFYVFPYEDYSNNKFNMEIGAILFNRDHGVDFNKWIREGVSYVNNEQLKRLSEHLLNDNINKYNPMNSSMYKRITLYKKTDMDKYNRFVEQFEKFYNASNEKMMVFEKLQRHIMIYFLNCLPEVIRNQIYITNESKNSIKITKVTKDEKMLKLNMENNVAIETIIKAKGIKNIYDKIIEKKKILVGHNCIIDFLYCTTHFMDELPNKYETFKTRICNYYGGIYDTKYLYLYSNKENANINDTSFHLEDLYKSLHEKYKDKITISIPEKEQFINYLDSKEKEKEKFHQADYDAFVTGCAFIYMKEEYGEENIKKNVFKFNLIGSIYKGMNMMGQEELKGDNVTAYYIKGKNTNSFDIGKVFDEKTIQHIKKSYYLDKQNCGIILVDNKDDFEKEIEKCTQMIDVMNLDQYKRITKILK